MVARIPTTVHNGITFESNYSNSSKPTHDYDAVTGNITGFGTYVIQGSATLTFHYGVAAGQTINMDGYIGNTVNTNGGVVVRNLQPTVLVLDDPKDFHAHININYSTTYRLCRQIPIRNRANRHCHVNYWSRRG